MPGPPSIDLTAHLRPGDGVWWGQGGAEPEPLVNALLDQVGGIGPTFAAVMVPLAALLLITRMSGADSTSAAVSVLI